MLNQRNSSNCREYSHLCFSDLDKSIKAVDSSTYAFDLEQIIDTLDFQFLETYNRSLITVEVLLLEGIWQNKTYSEIAAENNYSSTYLTNVAAPKLLKKLSKLIEYRITKKSCRSRLTKYIREHTPSKFKSHREKIGKSSLSTIPDRYYSFGRDKVQSENSLLKDAVLFARIN